MTDTEQSLLAAVIAQPDADTPRLIYSDWLEEHSCGERAKFIRLQIEIARLEAISERWVNTPSNQPGGTREDGGLAGAALAEAQNLEDRERELLRWYGVWAPAIPHRAWRLNDDPLCRDDAAFLGCIYRRGFVSEITCSWQDWLAHHAVLLAACPIRNAKDGVVRLTQVPRFSLDFWRQVSENDTNEPYVAIDGFPGVRFELPTSETSPFSPITLQVNRLYSSVRVADELL